MFFCIDCRRSDCQEEYMANKKTPSKKAGKAKTEAKGKTGAK